VDAVRAATAIAAGTAHTCAVVPPDGAVYCWGDNSFGQLGLGASDKQPHPLPTRVPAVQHMSGIAAGDKTTFAWSSRGDAAGWGFGIKRPVPLPASDVIQIGAGGKHNCLVRKDGTVHCWGFNDFGQLGVASETDSAVPVQVPGIEGIRQVAAGDVHACALRTDGRVVCWGGNEVGQLGTGIRDRERHPTPALVMVRGCL
jgi:alpha-tubulin suppressor-like RCC1 family protein